MKVAEESDNKRWHVDRGIPIAVIVGMLIQLAGGIYWVGSISRQVSELERRMIILEAQRVGERLAAVEVMVAETKARVIDMNRNLDMVVQTQIANHPAGKVR